MEEQKLAGESAGEVVGLGEEEKVTGQGFALMDFDYEEAAAAEEELVTSGRKRSGDRHICVCGHPVGRHTQVSGIVFCKPTRMDCPCKALRSVLKAEDTRNFLRKTEGPGALHALGRGLKAAHDAGKNVEWVVEAKCDRCQAEGAISPVAVTQRGVIVDVATGYDALICRKCREQA